MDIVYRDIFDIGDDVLTKAFYTMSEARREKCLRFRFDDDRRRCIAADMLVREEISTRTGMPPEKIVFAEKENGKPFAVNADIFFSVTHSGNIVAAAFSTEGEVGIDAEAIKPASKSVMRFFCSESDVRFIFGESPVCSETKITDRETLVRFFRVWCFKEAFFKKTGEGIGRHAAKISYIDAEKTEKLLPNCVICATE